MTAWGALIGLLVKTGAAAAISNAIVDKLGERHTFLALALATMLLTAIGVFVDVAVITVAPVALSLGQRLAIPKGSLSYGLEKMSFVAILLVGTGAIAGIIKASTIKDVLLSVLSGTNVGEVLIAPVSGALMSAATASTTAGATVASSSFAETILAAGISAVWGAAMINSGATVLDHLPHGSFFHATGGSVSLAFRERLKLIPYETCIGLVLTLGSVFAYLLMR